MSERSYEQFDNRLHVLSNGFMTSNIGLYARYVQSCTNVVLIVRFRQFKSLSISFNSTFVIDVMVTSSTFFSSVFRWLA